ncbi:polysaccharide deacetylase family protein [Xanthomonas campestris]|uniref:polysaccharide deacetylase family protein n=1 Tax=Xanthomonas campestris TaxID=339 RepID=UPI001E3DDF86|nr:tetratricopeptide repeat protein [Xanthomonas campestris]MCC8688186.1 tetratricopeptide repeat protein [Xanthomonas campestris]MEA9679282.1 tetratricopeptide repeat protein [Xanthomonas campestris pv. raphani]MEA9700293.1 tetratricopeptide repeat protein [Xanthomonas campestris pv. raphani]MEA9728034.1 tetratricopeptide repeat protein [Xanthomonas campestris pv. raphani]MEA9780770.1 tetratricopeptide repeat protein [Xanthomonas campestris pv. raphani]
MMSLPLHRLLLCASCVGLLLLAGCGKPQAGHDAQAAKPAASATSAVQNDPAAEDARALLAQLREQLDRHRRIIVLLADEAAQSPRDRATSSSVGQQLFHENLEQRERIAARFETVLASKASTRFATLATVLDDVESAPDLYDADRLAFREVLRDLHARIGRDSALPAVKLHQRIGEDLEALDEIERTYNTELTQIFSRFDRSRAITPKREKWDDYVAHLRTLYTREKILRDHGVVEPYPFSARDSESEIFGRDLPPKTVVLTFDDGPHKAYTEEIVAILKRYDVPGVFFEVGRNLGNLDAQGMPTLAPLAKISHSLMEEGYAVGNHSLTHAQLSKTTGAALRSQVLDTDTLLRAVDDKRAPLFRFPYGARNAEGLQLLGEAGLKSIMWNIDSMDWADPVPESIVQRVLDQVNKEQRGIVLFHDIHDRAVKALPQILDRLIADGYQFAGWNGRDFSVARAPSATAAATVTTGYAKSWAIVIGIDDYARWPKLEYAANDAQAIANTLTGPLGFPSSQVIVLKNAEATRNNILAAFHDRLGDGRAQTNDRVFVFFAGHGATRRLASGRDLGYIIPVDSDPEHLANDAIAMSDLQNIAESLQAKHVLFVMDACYSGLGLTRGGPSSSAYLRENARRIARQMLTAGGADQQVADSGPNGHSVFTWVVLQALAGKGDLNGDGLITGTELAAYVAPAVSAVSAQTPAFGSLPGSQGGEFVFQVPSGEEFLTADTAQLSAAAIALNGRVDAVRPAAVSVGVPANATPVTVKTLQGGEATLVLPTAVKSSDRQRAQLANERGLQLYKEKRYTDAAEQFAEALKLRPDFALAANNLGFVYYRQERYAEAARWLENTLKIDPSRAVAYLNLGDAYAKAGDRERARKAYTTYLALQPQGAGAEQARAQLQAL